MKLNRFAWVVVGLLALFLNGCIVERKVTEGGQVIYEDTEVHSPFDSTEDVENQVLEKEQELGM